MNNIWVRILKALDYSPIAGKNTDETEYKTQLADYRKGLIAAEQKSQDDYDKTLVSLSGGALGISLFFIKDIIKSGEPVMVWAVIAAWGSWAISLAAVVISYFTSHLALSKAVKQTDKGSYEGGVGGRAAKVTQALNIASGLFFIVGVVCLIIFAANNIGGKSMSPDNKTTVEKGYTPPPPPQPKSPPANIRPEPFTGVIPAPPPPQPPKK